MRNWMKLSALLVVVGVVVLAVVIPSFAEDEDPPKPGLPGWESGGRRGPGMWGGGSWDQFDAMAEALDLTPEELFSELHAGKSLEDIAEAQGVDMEDVQEAMAAEREQATRDRIQQAVEDGTMTQDQADWMLEGIERGYMPFGHGFGGHRVPHNGDRASP